MELNTASYGIHVFGDSHSRLYSSPYLSNYVCNVYYLGAVTMHRIGRDQLTIEELKDIAKDNYKEYLPGCKPEYKHMRYPVDDQIKNNDVIIFVFGEIDIRNHYAKQLEKGRNSLEILEKLVNDYIETILKNRNHYADVTFCIQSVNPPVDEKNLKESLKEYPINGSIDDRIGATLEINKLLKEGCKKNEILFIDTATYYQNDESLFPINGLCDTAKLYEMDTRIKDTNVHVHMENPEGIEHALKIANVPINITYYDYNKKCKYSSSLNKYQRDTIMRIRLAHYIVIVGLFATLFIPNRYFMITTCFWVVVVLLNIIIADGKDCSFNVLEFRMSNCNNKGALDELGIPREYQSALVRMAYVIGCSIVACRTYYFIYKKNIFNLKFGVKFLK